MLLLLLAQAVAPAPAADGRVLGHFPYGDVAPDVLADAPPGFPLNACRLRREVIPDLLRLITASDAALGPGALRGLSCHRSIARQSAVFQSGGEGDDKGRAISVAPPGNSEHTTGYAIDFAVRPSPNCPDAEACMAATSAAKWLIANAPRFGFEQSFPAGNDQNVKWEPWHWRWVGATAAAPGAATARFIFGKARAAFPANPGIYPPLRIVLTGQPSAPMRAEPPVEKRKRRRR